MDFIRLWFMGYVHPVRLVEQLKDKPAPGWGFFAQLLRALMDSLLVYFPAFLLGRVPPEAPYVSIFAAETYYGALIWLAPLVLFVEWVFAGGTVHVALRLLRRASDFDQILNLSGMATLVVGAFLVVWDWTWFFLGGMNQYSLGLSHLVIDLWFVVIFIAGLKRILGVPVGLGLLLTILGEAAAMPFAILFMRSPY